MIPNPNNPGPGCEIAGIAAAAIVAWRAPSPSSPAPRGARRGAASGLDCSVRPSTVAAMPLTPHSRCNQNRNSPSQKLLTQKFGHSPPQLCSIPTFPPHRFMCPHLRRRPGHTRRIGVLMGGDESDPVGKTRLSAFTRALADFGWTEGRNVRTDLRWAGDGIFECSAIARARAAPIPAGP